MVCFLATSLLLPWTLQDQSQGSWLAETFRNGCPDSPLVAEATLDTVPLPSTTPPHTHTHSFALAASHRHPKDGPLRAWSGMGFFLYLPF